MSTVVSAKQPAPFSDYKPSRNAYTNYLNPASGTSGSSKDVKVIRFTPKGLCFSYAAHTCHLTPSVQNHQPDPDEDLKSVLDDISPILIGEPTKKSYHHLSAACHRLVQLPHNKGPEIHARIESELGVSVKTLTRSWRGSILAREPGFLDRFITGWKAWEKRVVSFVARGSR